MLQFLFSNPIAFLFWLVALVTAITIHEFAHAWTANRLGDPTPRLQGRLTLNPLAHLDPLGTLMLLLVRFGWGKPVQFDPFNLQNPKRDAALISFAGPFSNLALASFFSLILKFVVVPFFPSPFFPPILEPFIIMNVILAVFNLIPIHPLDGGKILIGLLPAKDAPYINSMLDRYGILILFLLIFPFWGGTSPISLFLSPIINFLLSIYLPGNPIV